MATCPICHQPMLTEHPHRHLTVTGPHQPPQINYPMWVGRLAAILQSIIDAIDHPDDRALADSVPVTIARKHLAELARIGGDA